jgi:vitamin B12 transporter
MNTKTKVSVVLTLGISMLSFAQQERDSLKLEHLDEVVITDSKFNLKRENSGKVITKITQKDLQNAQGRSVADIINATVGIEINGARSHAGQNLNYFVRGGRNRQVLILIDGIPITDASQIANDYDLRLLNADQVESIEILKGASSTLYGTGAASAVINIRLKKASQDAVSVNLRSTLGSNHSQEDSDYAIENFLNSVSLDGTVGKFSYLASFSHQFTNGLSAVSAGEDEDVFSTHNGYLKLGYQFSERFTFNTYTSFDKFKAEFDDGFTFSDADNLSRTSQYRIGISPEFSYNNGSIIMNAAYNNIEREIQSSFPTQFKAESFVADMYNRYNFSDRFYTVIGINAQQNQIETFSIPFGSADFSQDINPEDASFTIVDPYANLVYVSDFGLNFNAGLRLNNHSEYGNHFVYSLNPSFKKDFNFGYLKGLANYSTAFIAPSLYQLFEPLYGNTELKPEENRTIEVGAELQIKDKVTFSVVYFNRFEERFVDFVDQGGFVFQYTNVDYNFTASGIEFITDLALTKKIQFLMNGTYTKVDEALSLRIPEIKVNATFNYQLNKKTFMSLNYQYNDDRDDAFFSSSTFANETVNLKSFSLFDVYISHKVVNNRMTIFANMTNIFNEDYEELFGYTTRGRNINLGFSLNL